MRIPPAYVTSHVSSHGTPFLSTFTPIVHHPALAPQPSVQPAPPRKRGRPKCSKAIPSPAKGSKIPSVRRPVGRPRGSGHKQRAAAAQAAKRAALGLVQTQTAQKRPVGRPRKDKEEMSSVFVEFRKYVSTESFLILFASFDGLSGHARYTTHSNSLAKRKTI